jgi:hypothetical protein
VAEKPSPGFLAKFLHWRLKFRAGREIDAPAKGAFSSYFMQGQGGTARLINDAAGSAPVKLSAVAARTRYVPAGEPKTDPADKVINPDIAKVLGAPEITKFIASKHLDDPRLNVQKNLAVVLVQDFDAALRAPGTKEHLWSINWRVDTGQADPNYVGYVAWGLFTKVNGVLKPFYLAGNICGSDASNSYYYVLAAGDLDGDGIDEFVARSMDYEPEEDSLEILGWERGKPVTIYKMVFDRPPPK